MRTPALRIIETDALNAFATGLHEGQYSVTVTRGLVDTLDKDELEAVLAHEMTHVINRDVRLMVIASIFAGIITLLAQVIFRSLRFAGGGRGKTSGKGAGLVILVALAIAAVGYLLALVIKLAISRKREFLADAGAVELTKDPDAMISALLKISGKSKVQAPGDHARHAARPPREGRHRPVRHPPADRQARRRPGEVRRRPRCPSRMRIAAEPRNARTRHPADRATPGLERPGRVTSRAGSLSGSAGYWSAHARDAETVPPRTARRDREDGYAAARRVAADVSYG